jgi:hypothetical protein
MNSRNSSSRGGSTTDTTDASMGSDGSRTSGMGGSSNMGGGSTGTTGMSGSTSSAGTTTGTSGMGKAANVNRPMGGTAGSTYDIDPTEESNYWRENFRSRPYASQGDYDTYEPAYRYGMESYNRYGGRRFEEVDESEMRNNWEKVKDKSELTWERAKDAVRDAYNRLFDRDSSRDSVRRTGTSNT